MIKSSRLRWSAL